MRTFRMFVATALAGIACTGASAQDIPGSSPMDHAAASMAHTSGAIDSLTTGEVASSQTRRTASRRAPRRAAPAPAPRHRTAETAEACKHSTPILRSMGLEPHPDCR